MKHCEICKYYREIYPETGRCTYPVPEWITYGTSQVVSPMSGEHCQVFEPRAENNATQE